jgi:hypothetical protein
VIARATDKAGPPVGARGCDKLGRAVEKWGWAEWGFEAQLVGFFFILLFSIPFSFFSIFKFKLLADLNSHSHGKLILNFILCHEQYRFGDIFLWTLFLS